MQGSVPFWWGWMGDGYSKVTCIRKRNNTFMIFKDKLRTINVSSFDPDRETKLYLGFYDGRPDEAVPIFIPESNRYNIFNDKLTALTNHCMLGKSLPFYKVDILPRYMHMPAVYDIANRSSKGSKSNMAVPVLRYNNERETKTSD